MNETVMPPTKAVVQASALLYAGVGRFLAARKTLPKLGKYESDREALNLFYLVLRHIEAVCTLANRDLVTLPSALIVTRTAFETTGRILWMLHPKEVFDREARYLAHLAGEEDFYRRIAAMLKEFGEDGNDWEQVQKRISNFRTGVEALLPPSTKPLRALPNFRAMLKEVGHEKSYGAYIRLSQFTHGAHFASGVFRKNLGGAQVTGEFVSPESWEEPLKCAWWCLVTGGTTLLEVLGGDPTKFIDAAFFKSITAALNKV